MSRRGPRSERRFPIEPLERLVANSEEQVELRQWVNKATDITRPIAAVVAQRFDLPRGTVYRYRREGIPLRSADRLAIRAGYHPVEVWPDFHSEEP